MKKHLAALLFAINPLLAQADDHDLDQVDELVWGKRAGVRFGYIYANKGEESERLASPHMFSIGYEAQQTLDGDAWLDILLIQNLTISGLEQSVVLPSANALIGFEIQNHLQLAVGMNATIYDPSGQDNFFHLVTALGWTEQAGIFSVPLHAVFIPDVNDYFRFGVTTGVNW